MSDGRPIADGLRWYGRLCQDEDERKRLLEYADQIDRDHERRMEQAKREVRRSMAKDIRWAVTMFEARESRRYVREGIDDGQVAG